MLFEIYIPPDLVDFDIIHDNLISFLKFKNFLEKHKIIIYSLYEKKDFQLKKFMKLNIQFFKINKNITEIRKLWNNNRDIYRREDWVIHYNLNNKILEFDFIKMIFKKLKNTFVKKNKNEIYYNLFCINSNLIFKFINQNSILDYNFIIRNSNNNYFLKYMNIISKNESGENIYI